MNLLGSSILVVLILVVLGSSRRVALLGMIAGVLFLTQAQQIEVLGFNLFAIRFLELAGFIRVMARREFSFRNLTNLDKALIWLYIFKTTVFLLRSSTGQSFAIGELVDAFLCYFTFRGLLQNMEDFQRFLRVFIFFLAPYVLLVVIESRTGHNPFAVLGGMEGGDRWMRHDRPRCFGSFRQPDTLGMFAASFIPLYIGMSCVARERTRSLLGICFCLIIAWAANSGGPAAAVVTGLSSWGFWHFRMEMQKVRWGIVATFTALAFAMKAPVWFIFARVSNITGGDGWHRSHLIDVAYTNLGQWWFAGMPIEKTSGWFAYGLENLSQADITNQFISLGLASGLGAIVLLILIITRAFSNLGKALAVVRTGSTKAATDEFLLWGLGAVLVVHIVDWFGITYFDQMYVIWFMQLAAISSISASCIASVPATTIESGIWVENDDNSEPELQLNEVQVETQMTQNGTLHS
jgi:hypothetical protein